jgi:drug/metabolite transporter (DMT)-like permease
MKIQNIIYYILTCFIWGSTWLAITFQLGQIDPLVSIIYRFIIASGILFCYCAINKLNIHFSLRNHSFLLLQGIFLFGFNYWFAYLAETFLTSGLVAVIFSTIVLFNILNGVIFLGSPVRGQVLAGALVGSIGILLIFKHEITTASITNETVKGMGIAFLSAFFASLGNIISARNSKAGIPVVQANAYGMIYGAVSMLVIALLMRKHFTFSFTPEYISSLVYLVIFGSIVAFGCYLTLIARIGAGKAAYATLVFPIIALVLSGLFEGYRWTGFTISGTGLVILGNFVIIRKK